MRLTCPECAAQYEIADGLIPPEGRDVECSACGHGWRQPGAPTLVLTAEAAVEDDFGAEFEAGDDLPPPPSRRLPDPVFSILREEAERELSARAAERADPRDPEAVEGATGRAAPQAAPTEAGLPDPYALAASLQWEVAGRPEAEAPPPRLPRPEAASALPPRLPARAVPTRPRAPTHAAAALRQRRAQDRGFALGLLLAALLAGAYVAAPSFADRGEAGARAMQARAAADRGRAWLQTQAESLADRAIAGGRSLFE